MDMYVPTKAGFLKYIYIKKGACYCSHENCLGKAYGER